MKNQPGTMKNHPRTMKNHENRPGMRKCSFFVTQGGSQLTFITQNEKVLIFRYPRGVTTDLLDI